MARSASVSLSRHHSGNYRKTIGGVGFYFGLKESEAKPRASAVLALWQSLKAGGFDSWQPEAISKAKAIAAGSSTLLAPVTAEAPTVTVHLAIDEFKAEIAEDRIHSEQYRYELPLRLDTLKLIHPDLPLPDFNAEVIQQWVNHWLSRPEYPRRGGGKCSVLYCRDLIATLRLFVVWLDGKHGWNARLPLNLFNCRRLSRTLTVQERLKMATIQTLPVTDLQRLYQRGSQRLRLSMLLALNCAMKQAEIADLRIGDVYLDQPQPMIRRLRGKSGVLGQWTLWQETAELLRLVLAEHVTPQPDDRLLLSARGYPLVHRSDNGMRVDAVLQLWTRHCKAEGVTLSFKHVAKTAADMLAQEYGGEIASTFLCHGKPLGSADPILLSYTNRRFAKLSEALGWLREQLAPMFEPVAPKLRRTA